VKSKMTSQRTIDDERAAQIQAALIKAGYLPAPPSGHWDTASIAAMTKVQADNGWQTKLVPDSRALIKLGLGPGTASGDQPSPSASLAPGQSETFARN
jgi:peptidoglycan hydrolase-like protein with peptidoglycan-binding domain